MAWYYIILIIIGCIAAMYFTGLIMYVDMAKNCEGINLLKCKQEVIKTERGILKVPDTLSNIAAFSAVAGMLFPITWSILILVFILRLLKKIVSPITNFIMNKAS